MKYILILCLTLVSCGKQSKTKVYPVKASALAKFVNQKNLPSNPNLTLDKAIVNNSYPIEIALYKDGRFYYDLPNLGDGHGTWEHTSDRIELRAKRTLFNMYIEINATDEAVNTLSIQFTDRFGPNHLKMENVNI